MLPPEQIQIHVDEETFYRHYSVVGVLSCKKVDVVLPAAPPSKLNTEKKREKSQFILKIIPQLTFDLEDLENPFFPFHC